MKDDVSAASGGATAVAARRSCCRKLKHTSSKCSVDLNIKMVDSQETRRVKVLYTGGTIGMVRNKDGVLSPLPCEFEKRMRRNPQMHDAEHAKKLFGESAEMAPLVLPNVPGMKRVLYSIHEYEPLLDSSNMTMDDWAIIAEDIRQIYELFDGFVILHGTDTLTYTASALSFMLENLGKTVVITGSQIPIFEVRNDGADNLLTSLILAGNFVIPEVTVYFNYRLFRGNRTIKISSGSFKAFDSPNFCPLAKVGINLQVYYREIFRPVAIEKFRVHSKLNKNVGLLRIFPSISTQTVESFLQPPLEGVVLQTYGAGNIPSNRADLLQVFRKATSKGVIIINCTQCSKGSVSELYQTGKDLYDAGVTPGSDMTPEAAVAKLAYVLSKEEWDINTKRVIMQSNIRGELTGSKPPYQQEFDLIDAVARTLKLSCNDTDDMDNILFPAMLCSAVEEGDVNKLGELKSYGADMSATNADLRTPLHIASANGDLEIVRFLLLSGASVHMRDRYDQTPLLDAINGGYQEVIKLLRQCGAHLHLSPTLIGERLCSCATSGNIDRLKGYSTAGANLSQVDQVGRTALHAAITNNQREIIEYLLIKKVDTNIIDVLGFSPLDLAERLKLPSVVRILKGEDPPVMLNGNETMNGNEKMNGNTEL